MEQNNVEKVKKPVNVKKILKIVGDVLFGILMVFILFIAITNIRAKANNNIPNMFNRGYLTVLSDSMEGDNKDSFNVGDLIFVKMVNDDEAKTLKVGDVITYKSAKYKDSNGNFMTVSHRIITATEKNGTVYYTTQGDNKLSAMAEDGGKEVVLSSSVLAVYQGKWSGAGTVFAWFSSGAGFFIIVVVPCILFLIFEIINFVKVYMEYKQEKNGLLKTAGAPQDDMQSKIRMRKEAFADLVKEGTLTQEQADKALEEYINGLMASETEKTIESNEDSK